MKFLVALAICVPLMFNSAGAEARSTNTYRYFETSTAAGPVTFGIGSNSYTAAIIFMRHFRAELSVKGHYRSKPNYPSRCGFAYQSGGIVAIFMVYSTSPALGRQVCLNERRALYGLQSWKVIYWT